MRINEGNIFEAMRLVLPEHRSIMADWNQQRDQRTLLALSEDEARVIQYTLSEAMARGATVRLTLFGMHGDEVIEGVPIYDGRLKITTVDGVTEVNVERLIGVE